MSKEKTRKDMEKEVAENLSELTQKEKLDELIKDNKIEFKIKDVLYRVRKPSQQELMNLQKVRNKKYIELLQDDSYLLKEQLLKLYKNKGIDIEEMESKIKDLGYTLEDIQIKLNDTADKKRMEILKQQITDICRKQSEISLRIIELLEPCIENALMEFSNLYLIYLVLEKEATLGELTAEGNKKFVNLFDNYEQFLKSEDEKLIVQATANLNLIIYKSEL